MAIGSNKGQWAVCDNVLLTFIAGEDLKYEDKVSLQPDGKTLLKDPDGEYQVYFPKSVASGKQVEVLEIIQKGGSGSAPSDNTIYNTDGTLTGERTITQNSNKLIIDGGEFEQKRDDGVFTRSIVNDSSVGGFGADGVSLTQISDSHLSSIYVGDTTSVGGSKDVVNAVVANKDILNNFIEISDWVVRPDKVEFRTLDLNASTILTMDRVDGLTITAASIPNNKALTIDNNNVNTSGLTFADFNSSSPSTANAALLGVDASGNVVIAEKREKYRGELSAASGSLPTVDVQIGDHWFIIDEGDNFGNIEGVNTLSRGDLLFYLNLTGDSDPSNPQNWQGIQQNTNDAFTGFVSLEDIPQQVNLIANTPLVLNAVVLASGAVRHVTITDSTGVVITSGISITISGTQVTLESNLNLNNIVVSMSGVA